MTVTVTDRGRRLSAPMVAFQVRNRRGLGHQIRVANLADALTVHAPELDLRFHLAACPEPALWDRTAQSTTAAEASWAEFVAHHRPDVIVYDTVLPPDPAAGADPATRFVLILRHRRADRSAELFDDPFLARVTAIIVPHDGDEPGPDLPPALARKAVRVGLIARRPQPIPAAPAGRFRVTSTAGGGGFGGSTGRFFDIVEAAGLRLAARCGALEHRIVTGPNFADAARIERLSGLPGAIVTRSAARLVDVIATSDLVIAEGGYNTVGEVRLAAAAAVFIPAPRGLDDQLARVRGLAADGAAVVIGPDESIGAAAERIGDLADDPVALAALRAAHRAPVLGNERAAAVIAEVARCR